MIEDRDPLLTRLFTEQGEPAHQSDFMAHFIARFERDLRYRRGYRIGTIVASIILAALLAPWIAQVTALAIGSVATGIIATRSLLDFPMAWLVVCSMVATFVPVIYLGITRGW